MHVRKELQDKLKYHLKKEVMHTSRGKSKKIIRPGDLVQNPFELYVPYIATIENVSKRQNLVIHIGLENENEEWFITEATIPNDLMGSNLYYKASNSWGWECTGKKIC